MNAVNAPSVGCDDDALSRRRPASDHAKDALAGERHPHRPADLAGGHHAQLVGTTSALAAEAPAHEWRQQLHVLFLQAEDVREAVRSTAVN